MSEEKTVIDALKEKVRVYKQTVDELEKAQKTAEKYQAHRNSVGELAENQLLQKDFEAFYAARRLFIYTDTLAVIASTRADQIKEKLAAQILEIIDTIALLT